VIANRHGAPSLTSVVQQFGEGVSAGTAEDAAAAHARRRAAPPAGLNLFRIP
jgi:hypothetical protein